MDLSELRLVALGHGSAGKSSCLAAMYTRLVAGRKGFRLVTADTALAQHLTATCKLLGRGSHPPPSSRRTELTAGLTFGRREVLGFAWTDYRGGALTGSAADDPETAQLLERLTHADAVVVFADTQRLATDPESQDEVRRTVVLLHRAVDEQPTPLPVVLVCTKADLVTDPADWARARVAAAPLEELLVSGGRVRGTAVAVSCGTSTRGGAVSALWCLSVLLTHRADEVARSLGSTRELIKDLLKQANGTDSTVSWFEGVESAAERLKYWEEAGREEKAEPALLDRPSRRPARLLNAEQRGTVPPAAAPVPSAAR